MTVMKKQKINYKRLQTLMQISFRRSTTSKERTKKKKQQSNGNMYEQKSRKKCSVKRVHNIATAKRQNKKIIYM